jgi:integrase
MQSTPDLPAASLVARDQNGRIFYEAKFRHDGAQVWRRIGPAWLEVDPNAADGSSRTERFRPRRGRVPAGYFDERAAHIKAAEIVKSYVTEAAEAERRAEERRKRGATFMEVAHAYLVWLQNVQNAAPSTLRQHRSDLAEPDVRYKRGDGVTAGHIMRAFGSVPAVKVTTGDVDKLLETVAETGVSPRTVNRYRDVVRAVFNFGMKSSKFQLPGNPATGADTRRVSALGDLVYYTPDEIELVARALEQGLHHQVNENHTRACGSRRGVQCDCRPTYGARGKAFETLEAARDWYRDSRTADELMADLRDADAVRVAAYAGLRMGELLALRVGDIHWSGSVITVKRAVSAGVEKGPKSGRARRVPLAKHAATALERVLDREDFVSSDDYVFCNAYGRRLDDSALRRRYKLARDAVGLRQLRWHDLRHTFGSLLVAGGIDLVSVKDAMGHTQLTTTTRYLHARPATERAAAFTAAFDTATTGGAA